MFAFIGCWFLEDKDYIPLVLIIGGLMDLFIVTTVLGFLVHFFGG